LLSGRYGIREKIKKERALFLKEHKVKSLSALIKSKPFKYQQTHSESKRKAGFSSIKFGFSPLSVVKYPLFDPSRCYPLSTGSSWKLQASSIYSFKVLDIFKVDLFFNNIFWNSPCKSKGAAYCKYLP
jgi:hypothetical protein